MTHIKLSIIEDEDLVRDSLAMYFMAQEQILLLSVHPSVEHFLANPPQAASPNILLLDINMPGMNGLQGIGPILTQHPQCSIIMLTSSEDEEHVFSALRLGATGYLSKQAKLETIAEAIDVIYRGGSFMSPSIARHVVNYFRQGVRPIEKMESNLTDRQKEILNGLAEGKSYKMIADACDITLETVRDHIKKIYKKLQINSRGELVSMFLDKKI